MWASQFALVVSNLTASARDIRDMDSIPGSGWSPGGGHGNPLQYPYLENPMDTGAWWATSTGSQRVRHSWGGWACTRAYMYQVFFIHSSAEGHRFRALALSYCLSLNPAHLLLHWRPLTIPSGLLEACGLTADLSLWAVNSVVLHYEKKTQTKKIFLSF